MHIIFAHKVLFLQIKKRRKKIGKDEEKASKLEDIIFGEIVFYQIKKKESKREFCYKKNTTIQSNFLPD